MSRSTFTNGAVSIPAPLQPATLRVASALVVAAALTVFAVRTQAQIAAPSAFHLRPVVGALIPTGDERDLLKSAVLVGGQGSYAFLPSVALVGSFGWSPSKDKTSPTEPRVNLYQYDLGIEGKLGNLTPDASIATRPYIAIGGGARTYDLRNLAGVSAQTDPLGYAAVGVDIGQSDGSLGLRLEGRDNVTSFKGLRGELQSRKARNDFQVALGLAVGF